MTPVKTGFPRATRSLQKKEKLSHHHGYRFSVDHSDGCVSIATIAGECTRFPFDRKDHCKMKFSSSYHIDQASTKFQTGRLRPEVKGLALPAI